MIRHVATHHQNATRALITLETTGGYKVVFAILAENGYGAPESAAREVVDEVVSHLESLTKNPG